MKSYQILGALLLAAGLAACGGGGGADTLTTPVTGGGGTGGGGTGGGGTGGGGTTAPSPVTMGATVNGTFTSGAIGLPSGTTQLAEGGSVSLSVEFRNATGPISEPAEVSFTSNCLQQGTATITPQNAQGVNSPNAVAQNGVATARYVNTGCSLTQDTVTARLERAPSGTVTPTTATVSIGIVPSQVGSIVFESATPTNIGLQGTGRDETSIVSFVVRSQGGGPRAGANVTFALSTTVGGLQLVGADANGTRTVTTGADGRAQVTVRSGTQATTVRVTATTQSAAGPISTQSSQLTVTTGIPDADSFSLSASCFNIEGLQYDGTKVEVTARLADRFNNPVPDGTAVNFRAEGGRIVPQCTTGVSGATSGLCTVEWESAAPRPADGRVTILATAIGEETFRDANGNGIFDSTDAATPANFVSSRDGFVDILTGAVPANSFGEPFLDDDEDAVYDNGESFFDFDNDQTRDAQDNLFAGLLCGSGAPCAQGPNGLQTTTGIGDSLVLIMSGSSAEFPNLPGTVDVSSAAVPARTSATISLVITDVNGNPLPAGTTITASGTGFTLGQPREFEVPCGTARVNLSASPLTGGFAGGLNVFSWTVTRDTTPGGGTLTIEVETPRGIRSLRTIQIVD